MGDELFDIDVVRDFMISRNGKVTNHELVTHFKPFLNDPKHRAGNRVKFKDFVNKLATVKLDESGEKVLVLKKKFREASGGTASSGGQQSEVKETRGGASRAKKSRHDKGGAAAGAGEADGSGLDASAVSVDVSVSQAPQDKAGMSDMLSALYDAAAAGTDKGSPQEPPPSEAAAVTAAEKEVPAVTGSAQPQRDTSEASPATNDDPTTEASWTTNRDDETMETMETSDIVSLSPSDSTPSEASEDKTIASVVQRRETPIEKQDEAMPVEPSENGAIEQESPVVSEEAITASSALAVESSSPSEREQEDEVDSGDVMGKSMNVKERAKHLNKMTSESDLNATLPVAQKSAVSQEGKEDEDSQYTNSGEMISLEAEEKEWMVLCSTADYHPMNKMLIKNKYLAKLRDFTCGYTALHWAAKHGQAEVVKMLCGTNVVNVNARSHGGYTPLHLAAMQGHEGVLELLVSTYKANPNLRDYSGKKPKQYLRHSASSRAQHILQSLQQGSTSEYSQFGQFRRQGSYSEKIHKSGYFGISVSPAMRSSWAATREGSAERKPTRSPSWSPSVSPKVIRKSSLPRDADMAMMPPPQNFPKKKKEKKSKHNKENEQGSSRESNGSRQSDPEMSAFPNYEGTTV